MDKQKGWKIFPSYRTLSPIGAAALPSPMKTKEKVEQGKGTTAHLIGCINKCTDKRMWDGQS